MTVPASPTSVEYAGAGSPGPFAIPFYFLQNSHIYAIKTDAQGVETVLVFTTDYTLTGAYVQAGGSLTLVDALAIGETLLITRSIPIEQLTDYLRNDVFPAQSTEDALDKLTMIIQQLSNLGVQVSPTTYNIYGPQVLPPPILDYYLHVNAITYELEWRPVSSISALRSIRTIAAVAGVLTLDCSLGDRFQCTLTANITSIVLTNLPPAGSVVEFTIEFFQGGSGSYTVTWPAACKHSGGTPVLSTAVGAEDHIGIVAYANGNLRTYPALAYAH